MSETRRDTLILLCGLAAVAMAALVLATNRGAGLSPDTVTFAKAAQNLAGGRGLGLGDVGAEVSPLTHYPPLYPALLGAIVASGHDMYAGARWLNVLCFGASVLIVGLAVYEATHHSQRAALLGALLMATSVDILRVYDYALSEAPFITLGAAALLLLAAYTERPRWWLLGGSGVAMAGALLTRYTGPALIASGALVLLFWGPGSVRARVARAAGLVTISCAPLTLWLSRNLRLAGSVTDRKLLFHPPNLEQVQDAALTITGWLLPSDVLPRQYVLLGTVATAEVAVLGLMAMAVVRLRRVKPSPAMGVPTPKPARGLELLALFIGAYWAEVLVSISFFDAHTPLNARILSPALVAVLVLAVGLAYELAGYVKHLPAARTALLLVAVAYAGFYCIQGMRTVVDLHENGLGYTTPAWQRSKLIARVRKLPPGTVIVTNGPDVVYLLTGRYADTVPETADRLTRVENSDYPDSLSQVRKKLEAGGVLVYFRSIERWYLPTEEELRQALPLELEADYSDGAVYTMH